MKRSSRIAVVLDIERRQEEALARTFEQSRMRLDTEKQKLSELERYYDEYSQQFQARTQCIRAAEINASREFLQQMNLVKQQQGGQIAMAERAQDDAMKAWHGQHLKYVNLQKLVAKIRADETALEDKQEQKLIDDWVTQRQASTR